MAQKSESQNHESYRKRDADHEMRNETLRNLPNQQMQDLHELESD